MSTFTFSLAGQKTQIPIAKWPAGQDVGGGVDLVNTGGTGPAARSLVIEAQMRVFPLRGSHQNFPGEYMVYIHQDETEPDAQGAFVPVGSVPTQSGGVRMFRRRVHTDRHAYSSVFHDIDEDHTEERVTFIDPLNTLYTEQFYVDSVLVSEFPSDWVDQSNYPGWQSPPNYVLTDNRVFGLWFESKGDHGDIPAKDGPGGAYWLPGTWQAIVESYVAECVTVLEMTATKIKLRSYFSGDINEGSEEDPEWYNETELVEETWEVSVEDTWDDCVARAENLMELGDTDPLWVITDPESWPANTGNRIGIVKQLGNQIGGSAAAQWDNVSPAAIATAAGGSFTGLLVRPNDISPFLHGLSGSGLYRHESAQGPCAVVLRFRHALPASGAFVVNGQSWTCDWTEANIEASSASVPVFAVLPDHVQNFGCRWQNSQVSVIEWLNETDKPGFPTIAGFAPTMPDWQPVPRSRIPLNSNGSVNTFLPGNVVADDLVLFAIQCGGKFIEANPVQMVWRRFTLVALDGRAGWKANFRFNRDGTTAIEVPAETGTASQFYVYAPVEPVGALNGEADLAGLTNVIDPDGNPMTTNIGRVLMVYSQQYIHDRPYFRGPTGAYYDTHRTTITRETNTTEDVNANQATVTDWQWGTWRRIEVYEKSWKRSSPHNKIDRLGWRGPKLARNRFISDDLVSKTMSLDGVDYAPEIEDILTERAWSPWVALSTTGSPPGTGLNLAGTPVTVGDKITYTYTGPVSPDQAYLVKIPQQVPQVPDFRENFTGPDIFGYQTHTVPGLAFTGYTEPMTWVASRNQYATPWKRQLLTNAANTFYISAGRATQVTE